MDAQDEPRTLSSSNEDESEILKSHSDENDDEDGPMSPNLKLPASRSAGPCAHQSISPDNKPRFVPEANTPLQPLQEMPSLERRLRTMALLHAKTTSQLLQVQKDRHDADQLAGREDANFELLELRQELALKQAECDALQRALDTELAAWASRCAASEARSTALYAERASLAAETHRLRAEADGARDRTRSEVEACARRGDDQLDQLSRLFLLSATRGRSPRAPVKPSGSGVKISPPTIGRNIK